MALHPYGLLHKTVYRAGLTEAIKEHGHHNWLSFFLIPLGSLQTDGSRLVPFSFVARLPSLYFLIACCAETPLSTLLGKRA